MRTHPSVLQPLEPNVDHVRGDPGGRSIVEYGDCESPYSRGALRQIELVDTRLDGLYEADAPLEAMR